MQNFFSLGAGNFKEVWLYLSVRQNPNLHTSVQNAFSRHLHHKLICISENTLGKVLHNSFVLFFHCVSTKTRYNSSKYFGVSFFWPLYSKHMAALSRLVAPVTLPPVLPWRCNCNFSQQGFLNLNDTYQSSEKFDNDKSKRKIFCPWGSSEERRVYLATFWGYQRGEKESNMIFKSYVLHLYTHRCLKGLVILMDEQLCYPMPFHLVHCEKREWIIFRWIFHDCVKSLWMIRYTYRECWKTHQSVQLFRSLMF